MATILRLYSYLYHLALSVFLLGVSAIALLSDSTSLRLEMLPWTGQELTYWVFFGSLFGILCVLLAATGAFPYIFPLWTLFVLVLMIRGFLLQPYRFSGTDQFYSVLVLILG
ncbi:MAG: hypothetical protein ACRD7E_18925, partial [Bryobacteraceae bacterium]